MLKIASLGTCLSNLTAVHLASLFGCDRRNNLVLARSDHFLRTFVEKVHALPPVAVMEELLGLDPFDPININFSLLENYPRLAGVAELPKGTTPFLDNLTYDHFDVIILDNLGDTNHTLTHYHGPDFPHFTINFPIFQAPRGEEFWTQCSSLPYLTAVESAANWARIIRFLMALQPRARIVFICAQACTSRDLPDRHERAARFPHELKLRVADLDVDIVMPLELADNLTRLPEDREHFDMSVYKALAGQIYLSTVADWPRSTYGQAVVAPAAASRTETPTPLECASEAVASQASYGRVGPGAASTISSPLMLIDVVAEFLGVSAATLTERSGANATENWDSLAQVNLMSRLEQVFQIKFAFDDITDATSVEEIRAAMRHRGVVTADDPGEDRLSSSAPEIASSNLFGGFARRAYANPAERYALFVKERQGREITCGWVLGHAMGVATSLSHVGRGAVIAIVLDHNEYMYSNFIGCVLSGLVPTNLSPLTPKQDPELFQASMQTLFNRIQPAVVLTSRKAAASIPQTTAPLVFVEDLAPIPWEDVASQLDALLGQGTASDLAFLQHSSGTTGHKKGVMLTHGKVQAQLEACAGQIGLEPGDGVASWLPLYHDMGLITSFIMPTVKGCPIVSLDALEWVSQPTMLLDYIESEDARFAWLPNFAFHHIVRADNGARRWRLGGMKGLINCSEPCRSQSFDVFLERYEPMGLDRSKLGVSYAMAENVFAVTQTNLGGVYKSARFGGAEYLSSGLPLANVEVEIRDDSGRKVEACQLGEIYLRSNCMFDGYFKMPELSAERIRDGWYATRDLGALVDGELFVVGRVDDLLIVNGKNIVAHEVEDALNGVSKLLPGRVLLASVYQEDVGASKLVVLAETDAQVDGETALAEDIRNLVFSLTGVAPSQVRLLPRGFLVKSTSGKLARAQSLDKWRRSETSAASTGLQLTS